MTVNQPTLALLDHLKATDRPLSGQALAQAFGISRVALWKRIEALRAAGYPVVGTSAGYRLERADPIHPWEFDAAEGRVLCFDELESTMDTALALALEGADEGTVVHAERQRAGRGQHGRPWQTLSGNLCLTLVLRPRLPWAFAGAVGLEALALLADVLADLYGVQARLKWPNDLVVGGAKVAGVLVEAAGGAEAPRWYTVGLGLNVRAVPELGRPVTSLEGSTGVRVDRRDILRAFRARLTTWSRQPVLNPARWSRLHLAPTPWTVDTWDGQTVSGTVLGFERDGSLILSRQEQSTTLRYGTTVRIEGALE